MKNYVVDYESYYSKKEKISVTDAGNRNYYRLSHAYILSVVGDGLPGVCGEISEIREHFPDSFWTDPEHQFWAANSNFDQGWHEVYFPKTARPWKCVLDLGVYHQFPRNLVGLARVALGVKVDKSIRDEMDGVKYEELPAEKKTALQNYCLNDSVREYEILRKLPPMSSIEDRIAEHTRLVNRRGVHIDEDKVARDILWMHELRHEAWRHIPWTQSGGKPLSYEELSNYCAKKGVPVPKSTAKTSEECTEFMDVHPALAEVIGLMRRFRRVNTLLKKAEVVKRMVCDGILPLNMFYAGAPHTRRWTSKAPNIQNLDKEPVIVGGNWTEQQITDAVVHSKPIPEDVRFVWSRNWVIAPPGKILLPLDYSQIEPRCLNWLAGNQSMLDAMRAGFGIYEAHAMAAKGWRGQPGTLKKLDPHLYKNCKAEVLGLGYGMGAEKFLATSGLDISSFEAKGIVDTFRRQNPAITALWRRLDNIVARTAKLKENDFALTMPTGDVLRHFDIKTTGRGYRSTTVKGEYTQQTLQHRLWGGTLAENITQRMARDVLAEAVVNLEDAGIPVLFTAHDEAILAIDDDASKEEAKEEAMRIMRRAPAWAPDLPLDVEGDFSRCYIK